MSYLNVRAVQKNANENNTVVPEESNFDISMYKSIFCNNNDNENSSSSDLKFLNKYILDVSNNIEKYIKLPLKELLLLINLIELDYNQENLPNLLLELKSYIKITMKNCNDILHHRFDIIQKNIKSTAKDIKENDDIWNSKLFIDAAMLIQKICKQKQIHFSSQKMFLCIIEIYNYFNKLSADLDPKFVTWFVEKFLCGNDND